MRVGEKRRMKPAPEAGASVSAFTNPGAVPGSAWFAK
jgi:hypothetical protein